MKDIPHAETSTAIKQEAPDNIMGRRDAELARDIAKVAIEQLRMGPERGYFTFHDPLRAAELAAYLAIRVERASQDMDEAPAKSTKTQPPDNFYLPRGI